MLTRKTLISNILRSTGRTQPFCIVRNRFWEKMEGEVENKLIGQTFLWCMFWKNLIAAGLACALRLSAATALEFGDSKRKSIYCGHFNYRYLVTPLVLVTPIGYRYPACPIKEKLPIFPNTPGVTGTVMNKNFFKIKNLKNKKNRCACAWPMFLLFSWIPTDTWHTEHLNAGLAVNSNGKISLLQSL